MSTGRSNPHPRVSVVMPFAGTAQAAHAALASLSALELGDGDELILADNCGVALGLHPARGVHPAAVRVIDARGERSPAHARNAGAAAAADGAEWILFLDADTIAPPDLLERYFAEPTADDVGAVAGGIAAASLGPSAKTAARYGAHKNFLDAGAHLAHPFMPRAAAANLLVRRAAFDPVGGFFEGLRAAEDTDFSWRLQLAGWTLAGRPAAVVEHRYRASLPALRRQWRGYAAGRAWLGRRYDGFEPRPALLRAAGMLVSHAASHGFATSARPRGASDQMTQPASLGAADRVRFAALDAVLGVDELIGFALSNRPPGATSAQPQARSVLVADRFPDAETDGSVTQPPATRQASDQTRLYGWLDRSLDAHGGLVRIEADRRAGRAAQPQPGVAIVYREDDGPLDRARAVATLVARGRGRSLVDAAPPPAALAPAACRLLADRSATLRPLSADPRVRAAAERLARLTGRELS